MDCGIHAREWIGPAFCQWFVKEVSETLYTMPILANQCFPCVFILLKEQNWEFEASNT